MQPKSQGRHARPAEGEYRAGAGRGYNVEEEKRYARVVETLTNDFSKDIEAADHLSDEEEFEVELSEGDQESQVTSGKGDADKEGGLKVQ